jgi:hypothetical protein
MPRHSFTERTPLEEGFAAVFRDRIVPILERHEASRLRFRRRALIWMGVTSGAGAIGALVSWASGSGAWVIVALAAGTIAAMVAYSIQLRKWRGGLSGDVLPVMCAFLGDMTVAGNPVEPAEFAALGVVPSHAKAKLDDTVSGTHGGLGFVLTEAWLRQGRKSGKRRRGTQRVFKGLLLRIELTEAVPPVYFARGLDAIDGWRDEALAVPGRVRIEAGASEFDERFETYTGDPDGARQFITPALVQGLLSIAQMQTGSRRHFAAATDGRGFYLALPRKGNFLRMGSLFRPLEESEEDFHTALEELDLPRRIITALRGF